MPLILPTCLQLGGGECKHSVSQFAHRLTAGRQRCEGDCQQARADEALQRDEALREQVEGCGEEEGRVVGGGAEEVQAMGPGSKK